MYKEGLNFSQLNGLQKLCGIYRLSVAEHSYIGSSKNLYARLAEHRADLRRGVHTNSFLQRVVTKYGLETIVIDIIELCEIEKRHIREAYWIKELQSDMNLKDPVTCALSDETKKKLSASIKEAYEIGTRAHYFSTSTIDCYDYFGDYITTFSTKEEAAKACGLTVKDVSVCVAAYKHGTKTNGTSTGKAVHGYRFRYSRSRVAPRKFAVSTNKLGSIFSFYYEKADGTKQFAFNNVKDCWKFFAEHCRDEKIVLIPVLKSRESWELQHTLDNHNGSAAEMP